MEMLLAFFTQHMETILVFVLLAGPVIFVSTMVILYRKRESENDVRRKREKLRPKALGQVPEISAPRGVVFQPLHGADELNDLLEKGVREFSSESSFDESLSSIDGDKDNPWAEQAALGKVQRT